ncbi:hypothetical protein ACLOJK_035528 [Asimina triloba]
MDSTASSASAAGSVGGGGGGGGGGDATDVVGDFSPSIISKGTAKISRSYQHLLDKSTPHVLRRWAAFVAIAFLYVVRVYFLQGFYIVSYGLGIYILNLLIAFLSPQVDPEIQELVDGPTLPTRGSDEFRPFVRRLPEFKFWCVSRSSIPYEGIQRNLVAAWCPVWEFQRNKCICIDGVLYEDARRMKSRDYGTFFKEDY